MASKLQTLTIKNLESNGYFVLNLIRTNHNGIPDLVAFKEGEKPIFIECKEKNDTLKPIQEYMGRLVQKYGAEYVLVKEK
jgi:hypothetical protein